MSGFAYIMLTRFSRSESWYTSVDGAVCGAGEGRDKKSAKRLAAAQALQVLNWIPSMLSGLRNGADC